MRKSILAALFVGATVSFASVSAQAAVNAPVPAENYITVDGLDWAWAAPCAAFGPSCGTVDFSYQSTQGWRAPTLEEFLARPDYKAFGNKCASAWFSSVGHAHCDFTDGALGNIFDWGYNILPNGSSPSSDSWVVRGEAATPGVPEPATWAMLIAGFGVVGAASRRRRSLAAA